MIITHCSRGIYGIYLKLIQEIQVMSIGNPVGRGNTRIFTNYAQNLPQHQHVQVVMLRGLAHTSLTVGLNHDSLICLR